MLRTRRDLPLWLAGIGTGAIAVATASQADSKRFTLSLGSVSIPDTPEWREWADSCKQTMADAREASKTWKFDE